LYGSFTFDNCYWFSFLLIWFCMLLFSNSWLLLCLWSLLFLLFLWSLWFSLVFVSISLLCFFFIFLIYILLGVWIITSCRLLSSWLFSSRFSFCSCCCRWRMLIFIIFMVNCRFSMTFFSCWFVLFMPFWRIYFFLFTFIMSLIWFSCFLLLRSWLLFLLILTWDLEVLLFLLFLFLLFLFLFFLFLLFLFMLCRVLSIFL